MTTLSALITADFRHRLDHPLSKSAFAIFNSGLVHAATYERDAEHLLSAHPEHCRIDIGWGAEWMDHPHPVAITTKAGMAYDFRDLDAIAAVLNTAGIRPYWSYCYIPEPFRPEGGSWRDLADVPGWAAMVHAYAQGAADRGVSVGYHEVYNEPDLRDERTGEAVFYSGDLRDYLEVYRATAPGLRKLDPQTPVGGPALALVHPDEHWIPAFLDAVTGEGLPLDFFSFHHYGTYTLSTAIEKVLAQLDARPELAEVEAHLNEYNSFPIDYPRGGLQDSYLIAGAMLADFARLLAIPGVTMTSWAQFLDSGHDNYSGMVDIDGATKPIFHAYRIYQDMPVDRYALSDSGVDGVSGLAAQSPGRSCLLVWNRSSTDVTVDLNALGVEAGVGRLVRIDAEHRGDTVEELPVSGELRWQLALPRAGVVYLELLGENPRAQRSPYGQVQRVHRSYLNRRSAAWADLEQAATTFRLGTADAPGSVPVLAGRLRGGAPVLEIDAELVSADDVACTAGSLTMRIDSAGVAAIVELGPDPATLEHRRPSWLGEATPTSLGHLPGGGTLDLAALGMDADDVTVTVWLAGAAAASFARVSLVSGDSA